MRYTNRRGFLKENPAYLHHIFKIKIITSKEISLLSYPLDLVFPKSPIPLQSVCIVYSLCAQLIHTISTN